jgi:uracil-DNA glycosylase
MTRAKGSSPRDSAERGGLEGPGSPVPPGTGWPGDPATAATPVAEGPVAAAELAASAGTLAELTARQSVCRACPRLVEWRERVAEQKRRSFLGERYWGRPIPGWGAERPRVLIVGLAPAAHGGNRTGRIFTGDRSGDVLYASLWRTGLAAQATSIAAGDGQRLIGTRMVAAVRCAPPQNKPSIAERDACAPWLTAELGLVADGLRAIVCLGHFAWQAIWPQLAAVGFEVPRPRPPFGHGVEAALPRSISADRTNGDGSVKGDMSDGSAGIQARSPLLIIGCYHPSQQNTFTGRVTDVMLDEVFERARRHSGL